MEQSAVLTSRDRFRCLYAVTFMILVNLILWLLLLGAIVVFLE